MQPDSVPSLKGSRLLCTQKPKDANKPHPGTIARYYSIIPCLNGQYCCNPVPPNVANNSTCCSDASNTFPVELGSLVIQNVSSSVPSASSPSSTIPFMAIPSSSSGGSISSNSICDDVLPGRPHNGGRSFAWCSLRRYVTRGRSRNHHLATAVRTGKTTAGHNTIGARDPAAAIMITDGDRRGVQISPSPAKRTSFP